MVDELVAAARKARRRAIAPYSDFKVGAALATRDGALHTGCNIENATLGLTVCAERVALWKALSEGAKRFTAVVVVTGASRPTPPCGACRQLLWEYCGNVPVHLVSTRGRRKSFHLSELLPYAFDKKDL
ncbi:MAG TPA: cytidine deaminase [Vicinamibacteria bacterium]|nr:cytidine deaminase [Vicinamibacteria bacterium]